MLTMDSNRCKVSPRSLVWLGCLLGMYTLNGSDDRCRCLDICAFVHHVDQDVDDNKDKSPACESKLNSSCLLRERKLSSRNE